MTWIHFPNLCRLRIDLTEVAGARQVLRQPLCKLLPNRFHRGIVGQVLQTSGIRLNIVKLFGRTTIHRRRQQPADLGLIAMPNHPLQGGTVIDVVIAGVFRSQLSLDQGSRIIKAR